MPSFSALLAAFNETLNTTEKAACQNSYAFSLLCGQMQGWKMLPKSLTIFKGFLKNL